MSEVKIGKVKIGVAQEGQGAFKAFVLVENKGTFDVQAKGLCSILHPVNRSALKMAELSGGNITIMPKSKRQVEFIFSDALPVGNYIASANLIPAVLKRLPENGRKPDLQLMITWRKSF